MQLELHSRAVGKVGVVKCMGRVVAGTEAQTLENHLRQLSSDYREVVLDLSDVGFLDSSGLGMLVRMVSRMRKVGGDLKLCSPSGVVQHLLKLTNMSKVFEVHDSSEAAISACYARTRPAEHKPGAGSRRVLCVHSGLDTLVYMAEVLRRAGYEPITSNNLPDAVILLKATKAELIVVGPEIRSAHGAAAQSVLRTVAPSVPVLALEREFSTQDAGQAGIWLLEKVRSHLQPEARPAQ